MPIVRIDDIDAKSIEDNILKLKSHISNRIKAIGRPLTYIIHTYGCQLNESDSEKIAGILEEVGLVPANTEDADVNFFNTCSIRENADDRLYGNLGMLKSKARENKDMIIAVCGCMMKVQANIDKVSKSYPYVDLIFDPQQIHNIPSLLYKAMNQRKQVLDVCDIDYIVEDQYLPIARQRKFRALVPIMYGCNNFCTYCIVPFTRGRERSRDFDKIVSEVEELARQGYKEIMLLGQNVNSYGKDNDGDKRFPDLLARIAQIEGLSRVRFMTSHPKDISDDVIEIMAQYPSIEKHLHLPMQSGSDTILQRMNRHYDREQYLRIAHAFRKRIPEGTISTDIIVGFPGETDEDFEDTMSVVEDVRFDSAFTFQYSRRPGTKAADYEDQVPHDIVSKRFQRLLDVQNQITYESNQAMVGKSYEILIEGISNTNDKILTGRTNCNHLVNFTIDGFEGDGNSLEGKLAIVRITNAKPYSVEGVLEKFV